MAVRSPTPIAIVDLIHRDAPRRQRLAALVFVAVYIGITAVAASFGRVQAPVVGPFVPICATLWGVGDLLTAYLLFTQFSVNGIRAFAILGAAYIVPGLLTIPYIAFFPNVFLAAPLSSGLQQVSVWLWLTWHAAFPIIVGGYHLVDRNLGARIADGRAVRRILGGAVAASAAGCALAIALIVMGRDHLPILVANGSFTRLYATMLAPAVVATNIAAAVTVFAVAKRPSTLQVWLMVALIIEALDGVLNATSVARYSVTWYVGKIETLSTATVVLMILLAEIGALYRSLGHLATIDALTGIPNRQSFDNDARWAIQMHARSSDLAFLVVDIDFFKQYNDTYGHQAGDVCLRRVAESLRSTCARSVDLVARYGGEEFVALLSGTTETGALHVAEAIRRGVEELGIAHAGSSVAPVVTVSVGVVHASGGRALGLERLFASADAALYVAKQTRNTVTIAGDHALPELKPAN